jgi:hypothetical protein
MSTENSNLQKFAKNISKFGFSILQQVAQQKVDSSDDESSEIVENEDFINNGQRGIVVYRTYSVKSDKIKVLHINLYKAQVVQYYDSKKRTYSCDDIIGITRNSDNNVVIEIKRQLSLNSHFKKIIFEAESQAHQFHQYIEFINESGKSTKLAFNQIDYRKTGYISFADLHRAMARVDIKVTDQDVDNM